MAYGGWLGLGWVVRLRVSEAFGFCIRDALKKNKYGTRTGVAELMCDQLGGDCSKENSQSQEDYRPRNGDHLREGEKQTGE